MIKSTLRLQLLSIIVLLSASVSYADKQYITAYDFQNRLNSMFSDAYAKSPSMFDGECKVGLAKFGFTSPATGKPLGQFPNSETVKTIQVCYNESFVFTLPYLATASRDNYIKFLSQFFPESFLQEKLANIPGNSWHTELALTLTVAEQELLVAQTVETMLGIDEVILSYGIIKDVNAYRTFLRTKLKLGVRISDLILELTKELALRNEFLTY